MPAMGKVETVALAVAAAGVAVLAGCGGGTTSENSSQTSAIPSPAATATQGGGSSQTAATAACDTLTAAQVQAVLGKPAPGVPGVADNMGEAYKLDSCMWGELVQGQALSLQIFTPGSVADPLSLLLSAAGGSPETVSGLTQGEYYSSLGLMPGGGGIGATVTWVNGNQQIALSLVGEPAGANTEQLLTTAAQQVNQTL